MSTYNSKEEEIKRTFTERVTSFRNIHLAYLRTKNNFMNIELKNNFEIEIFENKIPLIFSDIQDILLEKKKYRFRHLEVLEKPKKKEGEKWSKRQIARMHFFDAVIIQSVINILSEELEFMLPSSNFGYRLNSYESNNMYQYWKDGYSKFLNKEIEMSSNNRFNYVVELDIKDFYPSIDNNMLFKDIESVLVIEKNDAMFLRWIEKILKLEVLSDQGESCIMKGLPQGPLYSPLLALFYIRDYREVIKNTNSNAVCFSYVDDIRIYCETKEEAKRLMNDFSNFFKGKKLELNREKSTIEQINTNKKNEIKLMGRASNLDRALRDELIISSKDKNEMKEKLINLMKEAKEKYSVPNEKESKNEERLGRFVEYRIIKLLDDNFNDWCVALKLHTSIDGLNSNFAAMWHALYLSASTNKQKRLFIDNLINLKMGQNLEELSYVEYIIQTYLLKWSPYELKYSVEMIDNIINLGLNQQSNLMKKALLKNIHHEWIPFLKEYIETLRHNADEELNNLLNRFSENQYQGNKNKSATRLIFESQSQVHYTGTSFNIIDKYLSSEKIKNINYTLFENSGDYWNCTIEDAFINVSEVNFSEKESQKFLITLMRWLDTQFNFSTDRIPCSVLHPDYIYINEDEIHLFGNPLHQEDIYYYHSPNKLWREALIELTQNLFKIKFDETINVFNEVESLSLWKYRIIKKIQHRNFSIEDFVKFVLSMFNTEDQHIPISFEQLSLNRIYNHYIKDFDSLDKLLLISIFVENSWKNGAKECNFYTLHNHEHARYLIKNIHEIIMKSDFEIYINSKEALRLFSACYLHDIGMLSAPDDERLNDSDKPDIKKMSKNVTKILSKSNTGLKSRSKNLKLPLIYDIHSEVDKTREGIVRDEHPNVSEKELVTDYPQLPLTVAERRDIGLISSAHGAYKADINNLKELMHDGNYPIHLKLLSLLLRLADLSDVSKDRVRKEIIERNYKRMESESIFHWIKHLSVDSFDIEAIRPSHINKPLIIKLSITHNYLPTGNINRSKLKRVCGKSCKFKLNDNGLTGNGLKGFYNEGKENVKEGDCDFKYFDDDTCNLTCAFVNKSYNWFFAEITYFNMYLKNKNINVQFDLNIKSSEHARKDFHHIFNRNETFTAQEFMHEYFD
ncbi:HD domain-containing protein [Exiguobacterium chiriqhucha]|uniref:HD domain-containing protein n=1 Tax=Exiguobacterium chiriqhucha TaxID=1385984 RepID=UPI0038B75CE7